MAADILLYGPTARSPARSLPGAQLYQVKADMPLSYCMDLAPSKTGIAGHPCLPYLLAAFAGHTDVVHDGVGEINVRYFVVGNTKREGHAFAVLGVARVQHPWPGHLEPITYVFGLERHAMAVLRLYTTPGAGTAQHRDAFGLTAARIPRMRPNLSIQDSRWGLHFFSLMREVFGVGPPGTNG